MLEKLLDDARYAARTLGRASAFTLTVILTLALGIGGATAVFGIVNSVLLKPLPYPDAGRLVAIWHDAPGAPGLTAIAGGLNFSPSMLVTYRVENRSFASMGLWSPGSVSVTGGPAPEQVRAVHVTGGALQAYGVAPLLGRWLDERDEDPANPRVGMLGYGYWQMRFGGDPNIVGKTVAINGVATQVVGVMPQRFRFGEIEAEWIGAYLIDRSRLVPPPFCCNGVARLKPGVTIEQANADLARLLPIWIERHPFAGGISGREIYLDGWKITPTLRALKQDVVGNVGNVLWTVFGTIGVVLLIACANVLNLMLVRGEARRKELSIRAALGAGAWRIGRTLFTETLLLTTAGGAVGLVIAYAALRFLAALRPENLPRLDEIALDGGALLFATLVSLLAGGVLGLVLAWRHAGARIVGGLRASGRGASAGREHLRAQNLLIVGQVALVLVLLVGSGLMIRTFQKLREVDPGFTAAASLQTFRVDIPSQMIPDERAVVRQQRAILDALAALPGVTATGFSSGLPLENRGASWDGIDIEGREYSPGGEMALRIFRRISPDFLATMGTRVIAGRDIDWIDLEGEAAVTLVSESLARELWQSPAAALGKRIRGAGGGPWREIIGVVEDVRMNGLGDPAPAVVYWPALMADFYRGMPYFIERAVAFVVRGPLAGTEALQRQIEQAVWSVNPDLPIANMRTMRDYYDRSLARTSFTLVMLAIAAAVALVLGVVGLYGVLSYAVTQRRREIAIRLALGARQRDVRRQFVRAGVTLAAAGVVLGLGAAAGVARLLGTLLYGVEPVDPLTYVAVALVLIAVALLASYLPARRASAVDPAEALAAE